MTSTLEFLISSSTQTAIEAMVKWDIWEPPMSSLSTTPPTATLCSSRILSYFQEISAAPSPVSFLWHMLWWLFFCLGTCVLHLTFIFLKYIETFCLLWRCLCPHLKVEGTFFLIYIWAPLGPHEKGFGIDSHVPVGRKQKLMAGVEQRWICVAGGQWVTQVTDAGLLLLLSVLLFLISCSLG